LTLGEHDVTGNEQKKHRHPQQWKKNKPTTNALPAKP